MGYVYYTSNPAGMQSKAPRQPKAAEFLKVWFKDNWQIWESNAFSIYTRETANVDEEIATQAVSAVLRYLSRVGVVKYTCHSGYLSTVINENDLATVLTPAGGGPCAARTGAGGGVRRYDRQITAEVVAPVTVTTSGLVFFAIDKPLVLEHEVAFKLIRRLHA